MVQKAPWPLTAHYLSWRVSQDLLPTHSLSSHQLQGGRKVDASVWTELCAPETCGIPPPGSQNLSSVRVFIEVISEHEVTRVGPNPIGLVSLKEGEM